MKKKTWERRIREACKAAKTYSEEFDYVIETLAGILENRDAAQKQYKDSGASPVVVHTNKGGSANLVKNPALVVINDMNAQALAYWRDLGLTPAGLKKIKGDSGEGRTSTLAAALDEMKKELSTDE